MKKSTKRVKRHGKYDPVLKREIARRYLDGEFSYQVAAEEYRLPGRDTVKEFVKWYRRELAQVEKPAVPAQSADQAPGPATTDQSRELQLLRDKLRLAEQRAEAYKAIIDVASEELQIDIIKKPAPKPSRD